MNRTTIITGLLLTLSLVFAMTSVILPHWADGGGLFYMSYPAKKATAAMLILGILCHFVSVFLFITSIMCESQESMVANLFTTVGATVFYMIAVAVFGSPRGLDGDGGNRGPSYALLCIAFALSFCCLFGICGVLHENEGNRQDESRRRLLAENVQEQQHRQQEPQRNRQREQLENHRQPRTRQEDRIRQQQEEREREQLPRQREVQQQQQLNEAYLYEQYQNEPNLQQYEDEEEIGQQQERLQQQQNSTVYPDTWSPMETYIEFVVLEEGCDEFVDVYKKFQCGYQQELITIERVQNKSLYAQFQTQKTFVAEELYHYGLEHIPVTRELFHGTKKDSLESICQSGFDRSYSGDNAAAYGDGVYFATTSDYSDQFAQEDEHGIRRMLFVEVITGLYCLGYEGMRHLLTVKNEAPYHSAVDNISNPTKYIVFRDAGAYPSYVITYR